MQENKIDFKVNSYAYFSASEVARLNKFCEDHNIQLEKWQAKFFILYVLENWNPAATSNEQRESSHEQLEAKISKLEFDLKEYEKITAANNEEIKQLEAENTQLRATSHEPRETSNEQLETSHEELEAKISALETENEKLRNHATINRKTTEKGIFLEPHQFVLSPKPLINHLLEIYTERESERTGKQVTKEMIVLTPFSKFVLEGPQDFFPRIREAELTEIKNHFKKLEAGSEKPETTNI
jgi:outer membrane murein-binding lipoprotein Lpp